MFYFGHYTLKVYAFYKYWVWYKTDTGNFSWFENSDAKTVFPIKKIISKSTLVEPVTLLDVYVNVRTNFPKSINSYMN